MKFVTFGEVMLRLTPPGVYRFRQTESYLVTYAGAEANVAVDLAQLGEKVSFVSKLPDNDIGAAAADALARYRVNVDDVVIGGERMGLYYYEKGISLRAGRVIYDRKGSAISEATLADFDWQRIFRDADWYHWSGITPALSSSMKEVTAASVKAAKEHGLMVSCDLNYRATLWSREEARATMQELSHGIDVMITNMEQVEDVLDLSPEVSLDRSSDEAFLDLARKIVAEYGCQAVAFTIRQSLSASHNVLSAVLYTAKENRVARAPSYELTQMADRLGGGDSFTAGLLYALAHRFSPEKAVHFALAAECIKHTMEGDFNITDAKEVLTFMESDGTARIRR